MIRRLKEPTAIEIVLIVLAVFEIFLLIQKNLVVINIINIKAHEINILQKLEIIFELFQGQFGFILYSFKINLFLFIAKSTRRSFSLTY